MTAGSQQKDPDLEQTHLGIEDSQDLGADLRRGGF